MASVYLTRTATGLVAHDDEARDALRKLKIGQVVRADIIRPRNVQYHRRFFGMLNVVWQCCGDWKDSEELLRELKFRAGLVDKQKVIDRATGEVLAEIVTPRSIAFHNMDEDEFRAFVETAIRVICEEMVPGLESSVLREEVLRAVA
jgi:hypothetical protein